MILISFIVTFSAVNSCFVQIFTQCFFLCVFLVFHWSILVHLLSEFAPSILVFAAFHSVVSGWKERVFHRRILISFIVTFSAMDSCFICDILLSGFWQEGKSYPSKDFNFIHHIIFCHQFLILRHFTEPFLAGRKEFSIEGIQLGSSSHFPSTILVLHFTQWFLTPPIWFDETNSRYWICNNFLSFNPLMLTAAKTAWWFWWNLLAKSIFQELFEGEMYIRILPTTLLQMFSKSILNFWVIVKSVKDPDDNFKSNS